MLPRSSRLHASGEIRSTIRRGVRVGRSTLVLHVGAAPGRDDVRVGVVVSKAVGNAVTRNRVKRRIRHLAAEHLVGSGVAADVMVRALPRAATAGAELGDDLATAWAKASRTLEPSPMSRASS